MLQHGVEAGPNVLPAQFAGVGLGALLDVLGDWTAVLFVATPVKAYSALSVGAKARDRVDCTGMMK
jgi:hypothetical protein